MLLQAIQEAKIFKTYIYTSDTEQEESLAIHLSMK